MARYVWIVRDEDYRPFLFSVEIQEKGEDKFAVSSIQVAGWLVRQNNIRIVD